MIRLIQSLGVLALVATCGVACLCMRQWSCEVIGEPSLLSEPGPLETLTEQGPRRDEVQERASPLIAQAEALAGYLDPPPPPKPPKPSAPRKKVVKRETIPAIRPAEATPKFTVCATSYNESRPEKSIALIAEPGAESARWVREGERVGHFAIHEIKPGSVVYLAGEELRELAIHRDPVSAMVATSNRSGPGPSSRPRAAAAVIEAPSAHPTGPSRRPTRRGRRTVGSVRAIALD